MLLEDIINILEKFKVTGTAAGISGLPAPDILGDLQGIKNRLSTPTFLSEYHFIENNGQKA